MPHPRKNRIAPVRAIKVWRSLDSVISVPMIPAKQKYVTATTQWRKMTRPIMRSLQPKIDLRQHDQDEPAGDPKQNPLVLVGVHSSPSRPLRRFLSSESATGTPRIINEAPTSTADTGEPSTATTACDTSSPTPTK